MKKKFKFNAGIGISKVFCKVDGNDNATFTKEQIDKLIKAQKIEKEQVSHFVEGIASSNSIDLEGDRVTKEALEKMAEQAKSEQIPLRDAHSLEWDSKMGKLYDIKIERSCDENTGEEKTLLWTTFKLNPIDEDPMAQKLFFELSDANKLDDAGIGLSIGGMIKDFDISERGIFEFTEIELQEVSVTNNPANQDTFLHSLSKSCKSFCKMNKITETNEKEKKINEHLCAIIKMSDKELDNLSKDYLNFNQVINHIKMAKKKIIEEVNSEKITKTDGDETKEETTPTEPAKEDVKETKEDITDEKAEKSNKEEVEKTLKESSELQKSIDAFEKKIEAFEKEKEEIQKKYDDEKKELNKTIEELKEKVTKPEYKTADTVKIDKTKTKEEGDTKVLGKTLGTMLNMPIPIFTKTKAYTLEEAKNLLEKSDPIKIHKNARIQLQYAFEQLNK